MENRALESGPTDINPYAPPSALADRGLGDRTPEFHSGPLATPWQRWAGAFVDNVVAMVLCAPAFIAGARLGSSETDEDQAAMVALAVVGFALIAYALVQALLITKTGQSIGKRLVKTKIVLQSGRLPGFWHGVVLRSWLMQALNFIPIAGGFIGLVDALMVFRADRRCLHDHIAGTSVIQV